MASPHSYIRSFLQAVSSLAWRLRSCPPSLRDAIDGGHPSAPPPTRSTNASSRHNASLESR